MNTRASRATPLAENNSKVISILKAKKAIKLSGMISIEGSQSENEDIKELPSSVKNYTHFEVSGIKYSLGTGVFLTNRVDKNKPLMMKVAEICQHDSDSDSGIVVKGIWLYPPYHVYGGPKKLILKDGMEMDDQEVLFGGKLDVLDVGEIIGTFKVVSKAEYQKRPVKKAATSTKTRSANQKGPKLSNLMNSTFHCDRAWNSRTEYLVGEFTWQDYLDNKLVCVKRQRAAAIKHSKEKVAKKAKLSSTAVKTSAKVTSKSRSAHGTPSGRGKRNSAQPKSTQKESAVPSSSKVTSKSRSVQGTPSGRGNRNSTQEKAGAAPDAVSASGRKSGVPNSTKGTGSAKAKKVAQPTSDKGELMDSDESDDSEKDSDDDTVRSERVQKRRSVRSKSAKSTPKRAGNSTVADDESENALSENSNDDSFGERDQSGSSSDDSSDWGEASSEEEEITYNLKDDEKAAVRNNNMRKNVKKRISKASTPARKAAISALKSFLIADRKKKRTVATTDLERAAERLHVSAIPDSLPCREGEFAELYATLRDAIEEGSGMCLYVSGIPGTGKTATTKAVLRMLQEEVEREEIDPFEFVEINGMRLSEPAQAYTMLWEGLTGDRYTPSQAEGLLMSRFTAPSPSDRPCVVLMDELDLLVTKKQSVVYNFFDWPSRKHSKLIVIAIANTMDLPERALKNKVVSRLGEGRIIFEAYKHHQLLDILASRVEGLDCIERNAVEFCARKIAGLIGDARRCLDTLRRAVELCDGPKVTIAHVTAALLEFTTSSFVQAVKRCPYYQQLFLLACLRRAKVTGVSEFVLTQIIDEHKSYCHSRSKPVPSMSQYHTMSALLNQYGLIIAETKKAGDPSQKIRLAIVADDIHAGIAQSGNTDLKTIAETIKGISVTSQ